MASSPRQNKSIIGIIISYYIISRHHSKDLFDPVTARPIHKSMVPIPNCVNSMVINSRPFLNYYFTTSNVSTQKLRSYEFSPTPSTRLRVNPDFTHVSIASSQKLIRNVSRPRYFFNRIYVQSFTSKSIYNSIIYF